MAHQYSVTIRDAQNEAIETVIGTGAKLYLFSGAKPTTCADADPSGLLATLTLPTDWIGTSAAGVKAKGAIVWTGTGAAPGVAASFRFKDSGAVACHIQGTVGIGTGDLQLDNTNIAVSQAITISAFQFTAGNA